MSVFRSRRRAALLLGGAFAGVAVAGLVPPVDPPPPDPAEPLPSTMETSVTVEGITYNFDQAYRVGWLDDRTPVVGNTASGFTVVTTVPPSVNFTGATGGQRNGWVNPMEADPGSPGGQRAGLDNSGLDSASLHSDTRGIAGNLFTGQGVPIQPSNASNPTQRGTDLNVDPGYTGAPYFVPPGQNRVLGKFRSNTAATVATSRMHEYAELHVVTDWPNVGALPIGSAMPNEGSFFNRSDINLSGLPSHPIPGPVLGSETDFRIEANRLATYAAYRRLYHHGVFEGGETHRYNRGRYTEYGGAAPEYGRNIANAFSRMVLLLLMDIPDAEKREIAWIIGKHADKIRSRVNAGGTMRMRNWGGQTQQWPMIVAVAAWLFRGSANASRFTDLLPGGPLWFNNFDIWTGNARPMTRLDWIKGRNITMARETPGSGIIPRYYSIQPRPWMEGQLWAGGGPSNSGDGLLASVRMNGGIKPYYHNHFGSTMAAALFLKHVPGGMAIIPRPEFWNWYDYHANVVIHHRQYSGGGNSGSYRFEGMIVTTGFNTDIVDFLNACLNNPNLQWPFSVQPAPAVAEVGFTGDFEVLYEYATGSDLFFQFARPAAGMNGESWVWLRYNVPVSREEAKLPPNASIVIEVNGTPTTIDVAEAVTVGDSRTNAAIQARYQVLAFAVPVALKATDTVRVTTNFAALGANRPCTLDGQVLPDVSSALATWKANTATRPDPIEEVDLNASGPAGIDKTINFGSGGATSIFGEYLPAKYSMPVTERVRNVLIGFRGRLRPNVSSWPTNTLFMGQSVTSTVFRMLVNSTGSMTIHLRGLSSTTRSAGLGSVIFPPGEGATPPEHTWWIYFEAPISGGQAIGRIDNTVTAGGTFGGSWPTEEEGMTIARMFGGRMNLFGVNGGSNRTVTNSFGPKVSGFYMAVGTDQRPLVLPSGGLSNSVFAPTFDWGDRGQNVLPGRADYAGFVDGGVPEFLLHPTAADYDSDNYGNIGVWSKIPCSFPPLRVLTGDD